jgi:amino acid transporter
VLSLQAAASRLIYSYARDHMVFASGALSRFSSARHVPPVALTVAAVAWCVLITAFSYAWSVRLYHRRLPNL